MRRIAVTLLLCLLACSSNESADLPPNIVLIIGDDHGYGDFGFMGSEIARTPNLDRLAESGTYFPTGYSTASLCRPSLRSLLTGLHPIQFDRREVLLGRPRAATGATVSMLEDFQTLPALLSQRGYATFQSGKHPDGPFASTGFGDGMASVPGRAGRMQGIRIARETMEPVFSFIDDHREEPFFVWFAPQLPHLPHNPPEEYLEPYTELGLPYFAPGYFGSVTWFDAAVGDLIRHLEERGLRGRTLIVYVADNGWQSPGEGVDYDYLLGGQKGKKSLYEIGFRTPIVLSWPGVVPAGQVREELVSTVDLFPTLLDYAGVRVPANRPGLDLRPVIMGEQPAFRTELIGTADSLRGDRPGASPGGAFLRSKEWRYLRYNDGREALYAISADPIETQDVAAQHPDVVRFSREKIRAWVSKMLEPVDAAGSSSTPF